MAVGMNFKKWMPLIGTLAIMSGRDYAEGMEMATRATVRMRAGASGDMLRLLRVLKISREDFKRFGVEFGASGNAIKNPLKALDALAKIIEWKFPNVMEKVRGTARNLFTNMVDYIREVAYAVAGIKFGEVKAGGFFDTLKKSLQIAQAWFETNQQAIERWGSKIGSVMSGTITWFVTHISVIKAWAASIGTSIVNVVQGLLNLAGGFLGIKVTGTSVQGILTTLISTIGGFTAWFKSASREVGIFLRYIFEMWVLVRITKLVWGLTVAITALGSALMALRGAQVAGQLVLPGMAGLAAKAAGTRAAAGAVAVGGIATMNPWAMVGAAAVSIGLFIYSMLQMNKALKSVSDEQAKLAAGLDRDLIPKVKEATQSFLEMYRASEKAKELSDVSEKERYARALKEYGDLQGKVSEQTTRVEHVQNRLNQATTVYRNALEALAKEKKRVAPISGTAEIEALKKNVEDAKWYYDFYISLLERRKRELTESQEGLGEVPAPYTPPERPPLPKTPLDIFEEQMDAANRLLDMQRRWKEMQEVGMGDTVVYLENYRKAMLASIDDPELRVRYEKDIQDLSDYYGKIAQLRREAIAERKEELTESVSRARDIAAYAGEFVDYQKEYGSTVAYTNALNQQIASWQNYAVALRKAMSEVEYGGDMWRGFASAFLGAAKTIKQAETALRDIGMQRVTAQIATARAELEMMRSAGLTEGTLRAATMGIIAQEKELLAIKYEQLDVAEKLGQVLKAEDLKQQIFDRKREIFDLQKSIRQNLEDEFKKMTVQMINAPSDLQKTLARAGITMWQKQFEAKRRAVSLPDLGFYAGKLGSLAVPNIAVNVTLDGEKLESHIETRVDGRMTQWRR
jgi:hypothetical protein